MGGLLAFKVGNFDNTAEREQFRFLCEQLRTHYEDSNEFCVFAGNYNIGCELDALFIKKDAIIAIEFKNYGGKVVANENGEWTCDGKVIKGGSRKTVLQQARINHSTVKKELKILGIAKENIKDVPTLIIFNQSVEITNNLSATNKSWLHITDNEHFIEKLDDITCPHTNFDALGIVNLAETLNLNSFYLTEFSNVTYDRPAEPIDKKELFEDIKKYETSNNNHTTAPDCQAQNLSTSVENIDLPLAQNVQLYECKSQNIQTTEELMPLRNYAEQIVCAVWGKSTFTVNVISHWEFTTIFIDYAHIIKQEHVMPYLHELDERGIHYYFQVTLNDYVKEGFEPNVSSVDDRVETFRKLSEMIGKERVIWRFDPLIITPNITPRNLLTRIWNVGNKLKGYTDKLVFSFVDVKAYRKVQNNLVKETMLFTKEDVENAEANYAQRIEIVQGLQKIREVWHKDGWDVEIATCAEDIDLESYGIEHNRCIDGELMKRIFADDEELVYYLHTLKWPERDMFGQLPPIPEKTRKVKDAGQRKICGCMVSKDIGMYNTCRHFCVYCYANTSKECVLNNKEKHNDESESIIE